ncbi:MAG: phage adaptor protein [Armatimonadota bacterium]
MAAGDVTAMLISRVRMRINDVSQSAVQDTEILSFLDEAQQEVCTQVNDLALESLLRAQTVTLTVGQAAYPLPSDLLRERVVLHRGVVANRWAVANLGALTRDYYSKPVADNPVYYLWGRSLYLLPSDLAGEYTLHYFASPPALAADVDPLLGREFHDAMVTLAVARCRETTGDLEEAERLWVEFVDRCAVMNTRGGGLPYDNIPGDRR